MGYSRRDPRAVFTWVDPVDRTGPFHCVYNRYQILKLPDMRSRNCLFTMESMATWYGRRFRDRVSATVSHSMSCSAAMLTHVAGAFAWSTFFFLLPVAVVAAAATGAPGVYVRFLAACGVPSIDL